jgi:branched-chain amino acid transport system ATP-binding protein
MNDAVFMAEALSVSYGGVRALSEFSLEIRPGQLVGLIGPNGAGKTTFIDGATGFTRASGRVLLDGADLSALPPERRARRGLGRTWQSIELFDELTVLENLAVAGGGESLLAGIKTLFSAEPPQRVAVERAVELLGLEELLDQMPSDLSQGQRKVVSVARALAADPRVILLDEPAASLDAFESRELGTHLRQVVDNGMPLLLIDHDMGLVLSVCDYVYVLDFGKLIARGTPDEIRKDPVVIEAYLGASSGEGSLEAAATS